MNERCSGLCGTVVISSHPSAMQRVYQIGRVVRDDLEMGFGGDPYLPEMR